MGYPQKRVLKYPRNRKGYWTIKEVANILGMAEGYIRDYKVTTGKLKTIKIINGRRVIPKVYLYEYLEKYHIVTNRTNYGRTKRKRAPKSKFKHSGDNEIK